MGMFRNIPKKKKFKEKNTERGRDFIDFTPLLNSHKRN